MTGESGESQMALLPVHVAVSVDGDEPWWWELAVVVHLHADLSEHSLDERLWVQLQSFSVLSPRGSVGESKHSIARVFPATPRLKRPQCLYDSRVEQRCVSAYSDGRVLSYRRMLSRAVRAREDCR